MMVAGGGIGGRAGLRLRRLLGVLTAVVVVSLCGAASALADASWSLLSQSNTTVAPGGQLSYHVEMKNVGDSATNGETVTLTATLAEGMTGASVDTMFAPDFSCPAVAGESVIVCTGTPSFASFEFGVLKITADVGSGAAAVASTSFDIEGGGAPVGARTVDPVLVTFDAPVFGVDAFDVAATRDGGSLTQAGGHPDLLTTSIDFNTYTHPSPVVGDVAPVEDAKDIVVDLPPGLVGNPTGLGECTHAQLVVGNASPKPLCPASSQVGLVHIRTGARTLGPGPLFNMVAPPGVPARFGFNVAGSVIVLDAHVRTGGDYGLGVTASNVPQALAIAGNTVTFWGVPADPSHDAERACPGEWPPQSGGPSCKSGAARKAFFRNPTSCTPAGAVMTTVSIDSWQNPGVFKSATVAAHEAPGYPFSPLGTPGWGAPLAIDGCERVPFDPVVVAQPTAGSKAGAPSGFAFDVTIPQDDNPDTPASQSDLRKITITLPEGVRVNPSSADGLGACSSDQIALRSKAEPGCPDSSKLGTVTIDTPLLDVPVTGSVYLAKPFDNPFGSLVAVYVVASAKGVVIKLPGQASMDPDTGQVSATFDDNPQLPFSRVRVELRGGPRAPLVTPKSCGTHTTRAVLTGWNAKTVSSDSSFTLTENAKGGCASTFSPGFDAGTESNRAGSSSPFLLRLTRDDSDQELAGVSVRMPDGLLGRLAGVDLCSDAQASADACPAGSRIGRVTVGAGAGTNPFFITDGRAYLTGPYKGAPYGISIAVPAVAGPFDLGTVTVRSALHVDRRTAQVRVVSDPLPRILQGIPLDVRDVRVAIDRKNFIVNPTSCAEKTIAGTVTSTQGATANLSERFQAADCASLGFSPKLKLRMTGARRQTVGSHPGLKVALTQKRGQANIKRVEARLPLSLALDPDNANALCEYEQGIKDEPNCPKGSIVGRAKAVSPLLNRPLRGNVYFVKNVRIHPKTGNRIRTLPMLVVALRGEIAINLRGISTAKRGKLTSIFTAPDAPVSRFNMRIKGGKGGILAIARKLPCNRQTTVVHNDAHNGKRHDRNVQVRSARCNKPNRKSLDLRRPRKR